MALDFNDAEEQRSGVLIPDGTFVKASLHIRPGGASLANQDPLDTGLFKASDKSDAIMLDCEFTVLQGQYAHRKWWELMTIAGGSLDEKGVSKGWNMTKSRIRAMLESALALDPKDMSDQTKIRRQIPNFKFIDGMPFYCKLTVEPGGDKPGGGKYSDKNVIDRIIIPGDAEYAALVAGQEVAPMPRGGVGVVGGGGGKPAPTAAAAPAWGAPPPSNPTSAATAAPPSQSGVQASPPGVATPASPSNPAPAAPAGPAWLRS